MFSLHVVPEVSLSESHVSGQSVDGGIGVVLIGMHTRMSFSIYISFFLFFFFFPHQVAI